MSLKILIFTLAAVVQEISNLYPSWMCSSQSPCVRCIIKICNSPRCNFHGNDVTKMHIITSQKPWLPYVSISVLCFFLFPGDWIRTQPISSTPLDTITDKLRVKKKYIETAKTIAHQKPASLLCAHQIFIIFYSIQWLWIQVNSTRSGIFNRWFTRPNGTQFVSHCMLMIKCINCSSFFFSYSYLFAWMRHDQCDLKILETGKNGRLHLPVASSKHLVPVLYFVSVSVFSFFLLFRFWLGKPFALHHVLCG